jgi:hypothetical protein
VSRRPRCVSELTHLGRSLELPLSALREWSTPTGSRLTRPASAGFIFAERVVDSLPVVRSAPDLMGYREQEGLGRSRIQIADRTGMQNGYRLLILRVVLAQRPVVATRYPWPDLRVNYDRIGRRADRDRVAAGAGASGPTCCSANSRIQPPNALSAVDDATHVGRARAIFPPL